jgi:hypothetical protein
LKKCDPEDFVLLYVRVDLVQKIKEWK